MDMSGHMDKPSKYKIPYNFINSQLEATIIILKIISISSTCFGRSTAAIGNALTLYGPPHVLDSTKKSNSCTSKKKNKLNEQLYTKHLECASLWPNCWHSITDNKLQTEMETV